VAATIAAGREARRRRAAAWFTDPGLRETSRRFDSAYTREARRLFHEVALHRLGRAPARVLDVGCGDGEGLADLARRLPGAELVGIDPSSDEVRRARARTGVRVEQAGAEALPAGLGRFDLVLCHLNFGLWERPVDGLRGMAAAAAPGGLVYVLDLAGDTPADVRALLLDQLEGAERAYLADQLAASLTAGEVADLAERAGLPDPVLLPGVSAGLPGRPEDVGRAMAGNPALARAARRAGRAGLRTPRAAESVLHLTFRGRG